VAFYDRAQVLECEQHAYRGGDLEVGRVRLVASDRAIGYQRVGVAEQVGERGEVASDRVVAGIHLRASRRASGALALAITPGAGRPTTSAAIQRRT
jgi:hypothetical protein